MKLGLVEDGQDVAGINLAIDERRRAFRTGTLHLGPRLDRAAIASIFPSFFCFSESVTEPGARATGLGPALALGVLLGALAVWQVVLIGDRKDALLQTLRAVRAGILPAGRGTRHAASGINVRQPCNLHFVDCTPAPFC